MTITEFADYVRAHDTAQETEDSMAITQRLPAYDAEASEAKERKTPDPSEEEAYWARHYAELPYVKPGEPYSRYRAAFRFGWSARLRLAGRDWNEVHGQLMREWDGDPANFDFPWARARPAVRDAWDRLTPH